MPSNPVAQDRSTVKIPQRLFTPTKISKMELKNRLAMAPVVAFFEPSETATIPDFIIARARGGVGMIMMTGVA